MSILETVLKNNKPLNKSQIEAAEQMLNRALNNKRSKICDAYSDKVEKKYAPIFKKLVDDFNKKVEEINKKMQKEFVDEVTVRISDNYSHSSKLSTISFRLDAGYIETNHPIFKIQDEINDIILGMKLGENLKEEMLAVVNKINSIK